MPLPELVVVVLSEPLLPEDVGSVSEPGLPEVGLVDGKSAQLKSVTVNTVMRPCEVLPSSRDPVGPLDTIALLVGTPPAPTFVDVVVKVLPKPAESAS